MKAYLNINEAPKGFIAEKTLPNGFIMAFPKAIVNKCNLCDYRSECIRLGKDAFSCMSYARKDGTGVVFKKKETIIEETNVIENNTIYKEQIMNWNTFWYSGALTLLVYLMIGFICSVLGFGGISFNIFWLIMVFIIGGVTSNFIDNFDNKDK